MVMLVLGIMISDLEVLLFIKKD